MKYEWKGWKLYSSGICNNNMFARWIITLAGSNKPMRSAINKLGMRLREIMIIPLRGLRLVLKNVWLALVQGCLPFFCALTLRRGLDQSGTLSYSLTACLVQLAKRWQTETQKYFQLPIFFYFECNLASYGGHFPSVDNSRVFTLEC